MFIIYNRYIINSQTLIYKNILEFDYTDDLNYKYIMRKQIKWHV